jgi:AraC-like DNA-binding protein
MDALSEVLRALRLQAGLFLEAEFSAPWCIDSAPAKEDVRHILPHADHVALFHLLAEGRCNAKLPGDRDAVTLRAGDLILFPHGDAHLLGSDVQMTPVPAAALVRPGPDGCLLRIDHGGGGARASFVCGYLACDRRLCRPLLDALPRMVHVPAGDGPAAGWILNTLRMAATESTAPRPGTDAMLARLSELLFIEAVRSYIQSHPHQDGWFAGLRDPHVGRALALLHGAPARPWTVETLAGEVTVSRSVLAERFTGLIGEPPMQYLARWRMALAAQALANTGEPLVRIAEQVGYESESAFNRAFKREFGIPPAAWRRAARERSAS